MYTGSSKGTRSRGFYEPCASLGPRANYDMHPRPRSHSAKAYRIHNGGSLSPVLRAKQFEVPKLGEGRNMNGTHSRRDCMCAPFHPYNPFPGQPASPGWGFNTTE